MANARMGWLSDLLTMAEVIGKWKVIVSVVTGAAVGVWTWLAKMPGPTVAVYAVVVAAAVLFIVVLATGAFGKRTGSVPTQPGSPPLKRVTGQAYKDATVPLDGFDYVACHFDGCIFQYDGGAFSVTSCQLRGTRGVATTMPVVAHSLALSRAIGMLPDTRVIEITAPKQPNA